MVNLRVDFQPLVCVLCSVNENSHKSAFQMEMACWGDHTEHSLSGKQNKICFNITERIQEYPEMFMTEEKILQ